MLIQNLEQRSLINPPTFLTSNTHYLCRMGSVAYGVSTDKSDQDIYGVCIPPRDYIFPPNYIDGFDENKQTFNLWTQHGIKDDKAVYDFSVYGIVNYFKLAMDNNPNILDSLFVSRENVIHSTRAWENVRENRKLFLHKGVAHKLKGYAYSQLNKAKNCIGSLQDILEFEKNHGIPQKITYLEAQAMGPTMDVPDFNYYMDLWAIGLKKTSRFEEQKKHGQDNKFLYHIFRLVDQAEFILNHHDLDLMETGRVEKMKAIRRGDIKYEDIVRTFADSEQRISNLYESSTLRKFPPTKEIRALLIATLESHYGSIKAFLKEESGPELAVGEIKKVLQKYGL